MACDDEICITKSYTFVSAALTSIDGGPPANFGKKVQDDAQKALDDKGKGLPAKVETKYKCAAGCHCVEVLAFKAVRVTTKTKTTVSVPAAGGGAGKALPVEGTITRNMILTLGSCEFDEIVLGSFGWIPELGITVSSDQPVASINPQNLDRIQQILAGPTSSRKPG